MWALTILGFACFAHQAVLLPSLITAKKRMTTSVRIGSDVNTTVVVRACNMLTAQLRLLQSGASADQVGYIQTEMWLKL